MIQGLLDHILAQKLLFLHSRKDICFIKLNLCTMQISSNQLLLKTDHIGISFKESGITILTDLLLK